MTLDPSQSFTREDLFGGTGAVQIWNIMPKTGAPPFAAALWCRLEPEGDVGEHVQQAFPEVVICVGGFGQSTVEGKGHPLMPGAMVYLPLGARLTLRNLSGEEPLEYLIIKAQMARP